MEVVVVGGSGLCHGVSGPRCRILMKWGEGGGRRGHTPARCEASLITAPLFDPRLVSSPRFSYRMLTPASPPTTCTRLHTLVSLGKGITVAPAV